MDGSRDARPESPPTSSRLTVRGKNRRRIARAAWKLPRPRVVLDACGRAVRRSIASAGAQLAAAGVLVLVAVALWFGYRFIATSPRFAIDEIQVHGTQRLSPDAIRQALPVGVGDNVFGANLDRIGEQLRRHPWIAAAEARRILPHTLVIDIREYEAAAVVELGDTRYLVDATGHAFKRAEAGETEDLPLVTGVDRDAYQHDPEGTANLVTNALDVLASWRSVAANRPAIVEVHIDTRGGVALRSEDVSIQLGVPGDALDARMRTFDAAWAELTEAERGRARAIHLDVRPDHVTVAFKD